MIRRPPRSTLFPYTPLSRSKRFHRRETELDDAAGVAAGRRAAEPDLKRRLAQAIDELPHGYRTVFVMHDVEGYTRSEEHTSELQSQSNLVCRLLLEKKNKDD